MCPPCQNYDETRQHVLHMNRVRNESLIKLKQDLQVLKTNQHLQDHSMAIVTAWTDNLSGHFCMTAPIHLPRRTHTSSTESAK